MGVKENDCLIINYTIFITLQPINLTTIQYELIKISEFCICYFFIR